MTLATSKKYRAGDYEDPCTVCGEDDTVPPTVTVFRWHPSPSRYEDKPIITLCRECLRELLEEIS